MENLKTDVPDERLQAETPEDVAVLYSWANLQGAKYRDFSASRREYRAQMRHRQAEQLRQEELRAKAEAEAAAADAERAAREAEESARFHEKEARKASQEQQVGEFQAEEEAKGRAQQHAADLNRIAAGERVEAARRAEAVAAAEAAARREEREMAEAQASAARQAQRYEESEYRRQSLAGPQPSAYMPGEISDPYMSEPAVLPGRLFHHAEAQAEDMRPTRHAPTRETRLLIPQPDPRDKEHEVKEYWVTGTKAYEAELAAGGSRAIDEPASGHSEQLSYYYDPNPRERVEAVDQYAQSAPYAQSSESARRSSRTVPDPYADRVVEVDRPVEAPSASRGQRKNVREDQSRGSSAAGVTDRAGVFDRSNVDRINFERSNAAGSIYGLSGVVRSGVGGSKHERMRPVGAGEGAPLYDPVPGSPRFESPSVRRAPRNGSVENAKYMTPVPAPPRESRQTRPARLPRGYHPDEASGVHISARSSDSGEHAGSVPAWISSDVAPGVRTLRPMESPWRAERAGQQNGSAQPTEALRPFERRDVTEARGEHAPAEDALSWESHLHAAMKPSPKEKRSIETARPGDARAEATVDPEAEPKDDPRRTAMRRQAPASPVADTLQHSREQVAARWYALKGVFEHEGYEKATGEIASKSKTVPMLCVFSLAGGTGKTSMVATLGRALSASGERVLLTDTTSHGLLPFYFGASELRPGVVRTFSPPAGSSDAAIALVSYDVDANLTDAARQDALVEELTRKSRGMQRVVLDISAVSPWVVQKMAKMGSTIVVPVSPDMNSVISLGPVEKFFAGIVDREGRAVQPYYILNQFDASLPLHLDVREVMKQQLGERLLPFVIRRAPAVSEALAEGMTVIDYAPESTAAGDYMNLAQWLRMQSSPASGINKNARWSER
jgi:cellulose synthase operon protein YhjQ